MSMPSDTNADMSDAARGREPRAGERLVTQFTPRQRGWAAAALVAFVGVAYLGPALNRMMRPKSRARQMDDEARLRVRALRRRALAATTKARKQAKMAQKKIKRLGGGAVWR